MAPIIPSSLSPHVCILVSPDLEDLLDSASLPPLPNILQSFSPLPQVTTRTINLTSIPLASFALRFSDLLDVEQACREDDEQRAVRTIDWVTARINNRCSKWVEDVDKLENKEYLRTPWWDELRRCIEGDFVPSKTEGWNHPIAVILAASTTAPNPLQAITSLHSRPLELPAWVDSNYLKYTLIVHPQNSPLSDEEAGALFNAVKKQFGLHSYLLPLNMPKPSPPPVPVPALMPRLPPPPLPDSPRKDSPPPSPTGQTALNTLRMDERDIQSTAKFAREFVVMSLVPWMEKCATEWNETFSANRRLPSRLFSSTRRLFGSPAPTPPPTATSSVVSLPARSSISTNGYSAPPSQQRRLAEFSTILGDFKLATTVWEALRKENKGGSDMLPLLLAPALTIPLYAAAALVHINSSSDDIPPLSQLHNLACAVRWEAGIAPEDFLSNLFEGERWLVWAAGNAEEAPSALLLAHAALLSARKKETRKAGLWYAIAANRLEKCGIKPLTMYFSRKALELCRVKLPKELSPSFWDSEGKVSTTVEGLEDILSGLEHRLGRLLYTTGNLRGAVELLLGLLRGPAPFATVFLDPSVAGLSNDKLYLDDFRVAYSYWKSSNPENTTRANLKLPITFGSSQHCRIRFLGDTGDDAQELWASGEESWKSFYKARSDDTRLISGGKVSVDELFWVDVVLKNPLDGDVNLSQFTLGVELSSPTESQDDVAVEVINEVTLGPKQTLTVAVALKSKRPGKLKVTQAKYNFLGLLPITESLSCRGRRLHETREQRQKPTYAPDVFMQAEVVPSDHRLIVNLVEDQHLVLLQGEAKNLHLWLTNAGSKPIGEIWLVPADDDVVFFGAQSDSAESSSTSEHLTSPNSLKPPDPRRLHWKSEMEENKLQASASAEIPFTLYAEEVGNHDLHWFLVFREDETQPFHSARLFRSYEVQPFLEVTLTTVPSPTEDCVYLLQADITNVSTSVQAELTQVTSISAEWETKSLTSAQFGALGPSQRSQILLSVLPASKQKGARETVNFVLAKLESVLQSRELDPSFPPPIDLTCSHSAEAQNSLSIKDDATGNLIHCSRARFVRQKLAQTYSPIATHLHPQIFPLYNPSALDLVLFWQTSTGGHVGHVNVHGITLGAGHGMLDNIVENAENSKAKRSMYAETRRQNLELLGAIRESEWNVEMDPISVSLLQTGSVAHDFGKGPCHVPVQFLLRNHSTTHRVRYCLRLTGKASTSPNLLLPPYSGRLTFRGIVEPVSVATISPKLWIREPGVYGLNSWVVESELSDTAVEANALLNNVGRRRYLQEAPSEREDIARLLISDSRLS